MKIKILIICIIILIITITISYLLSNRKKTEISNIKTLRFFYTTGYHINADVSYEINCKNKCIATIKPSGISNEEAFQKEVDNNVKNKIEKVLQKYHVEKWDGFNKIDKNVLDGNSFSINISMDDDKTINASGYMKWPENYSEVKKELNKIFMEIYPNKNT